MILTIEDLRRHAAFYAVILLWTLVPVVAMLGLILATGGLVEAGLLAVMAGLVTLEMRRSAAGLGTQLAASTALAVAVSTIVYQLRGHPWQADSHMLFFAAFALTAVFCNWRPIVAYAGVIAVHHLVLNFAFTAAVFPGEASLGRVVLHAVVLIVQAVPLIWLSAVLARMFLRSDELLGVADAAREQTQTQADRQLMVFDETRRVVGEVEAVMQRLSEGDLTVRIPEAAHPAQFQGLCRAFNGMVGALDAVVTEVEQGANGLLRSSDVMAEAVQQSAERARQQSQSVEQSAQAMEQMSEGVRATTDLAVQADALMVANQSEAQVGGNVLGQAVGAMKRIEESSDQISRISGVMEDIAFQTNLLALNAGVEAARAGELGRGFAVVASEVRTLALRAADASKEIRTLIDDSRKSVAVGAELVGQTNQSLGALIKGASSAAEIVIEISSKMQGQTTGLGSLRENMRVLEATARTGAQVASQSSDLGLNLRREATAMIAAITAFRGGRRGTARAWAAE
jgi:methyl-accepting chemotaxis protein